MSTRRKRGSLEEILKLVCPIFPEGLPPKVLLYSDPDS